MKLPESFYERPNVVRIARELLGKSLFTSIDGILTGGLIVETEAYSWKERGCHAFGKKRTQRNSIMFERGGFSYVYLCYGMHHLFNVVTNGPGTPEAVLIRGLEPTHGLEEMRLRRGKVLNDFQLTSGPGRLTKALGIDRKFNGKTLFSEDIWIEDSVHATISPSRIEASPRIGIDYAGEDAALLWRFSIRENRWVSRYSAKEIKK
jgi:DNA-3-methyladenine glycosylase